LPILILDPLTPTPQNHTNTKQQIHNKEAIATKSCNINIYQIPFCIDILANEKKKNGFWNLKCKRGTGPQRGYKY
jgi:hypothetical protein